MIRSANSSSARIKELGVDKDPCLDDADKAADSMIGALGVVEQRKAILRNMSRENFSRIPNPEGASKQSMSDELSIVHFFLPHSILRYFLPSSSVNDT